jgi:hypothetical protein
MAPKRNVRISRFRNESRNTTLDIRKFVVLASLAFELPLLY